MSIEALMIIRLGDDEVLAVQYISRVKGSFGGIETTDEYDKHVHIDLSFLVQFLKSG